MSKPRVLLLSDVRGWAFDQNLQDMAEYCRDYYDFTILYVAEFGPGHKRAPSLHDYDVVFAPYHRWGIDRLLPWERTLGSLRSQWLFPEKKRSPQAEEFALVNKYAGFHVVAKRNYDEYIAACPHVVYLTNPVNMRRFPEPTPIRGEVVVEWNGNAWHDNLAREDVKGFLSIVQPACRRAGVPLVVAEYNTSRRQPSEMPAFYRQANIAVSASLYEGASSSCMEAMASGLALVATDVGNHREMRDSQLAAYGETGLLLVDRSIEAFAKALQSLRASPKLVERMGRINRQCIERAWSWSAWAPGFVEFFKMALESRSA